MTASQIRPGAAAAAELRSETPHRGGSTASGGSHRRRTRGGVADLATQGRLAAHRAAANRCRPKTHPAVAKEEAVLEVDDFNLWYGPKQALHDITMRDSRRQGHGPDRPVRLRQIDAAALGQPAERSDRARVRIDGDMRLNGDSIYAHGVDVIELRKRMGMVFQKPNPFPMSIYENVVYSLRIDGERNRRVLDEVCERSLRGAALWDEVKDRLHESALGLSGGQQQRLVHRPGHRRRAGSAAAGRALLGPRPDRHRQDRRPDPGAARLVLAC